MNRDPTLRPEKSLPGPHDGVDRSALAHLLSTRWADARVRVARRLESNRAPGLPARVFASAWGAVSARGIARPLVLAPSVRGIGVGGASLGGSYKTPFAIALARALASCGNDVALVGHAYRARPGEARIVRPDDDVAEVGDDALFAARQLAGTGVDVIVGANRQLAANFAAKRGRCLVFDGLLQTSPQRLSRSVLLIDGSHAWEDAYCPPAGDLRAPQRALLRAADLRVVIDDELTQAARRMRSPSLRSGGPPHDVAVSHLAHARDADGNRIPLADLRDASLGLLVAIARSDRVTASLALRGLRPVTTWALPDYHRPSKSELEAVAARTTHRIDAWLTTGKCATKLPSRLAGVPVLVLDHVVRLSDRLVHALFPSGGPVG